MRNVGTELMSVTHFGLLVVPCKECKSRQIGCHGQCEKYLNFRAKADAINADIRAQKGVAARCTWYDKLRGRLWGV